MKKTTHQLFINKSIIPAVSLSLLLAGCGGGIVVKQLANSDSATGNPWNLSMTQFEMIITRQVTKCGTDSAEFRVDVAITPSKALDEDQRYTLYSTGWYSTSDIKSKLAADGTNIGLNAQSENASATIITNTIGLIAKAAAISAAGLRVANPNVCHPDIVSALAKLTPPKPTPPLKAQLKAKTQELTNATDKVTLLTAQVKLDKSYKSDLAKALGDQARIQNELNGLKKEFDGAMKVTTDAQTIRWPIRAKQFNSDAYTISANTLNDWFPEDVNINPNMPAADVISKVKADARIKLPVYFALYIQKGDGSWVKPDEPKNGDTTIGIPVRLARTGRLLACISDKCKDNLDRQYQDDDSHQSSDQVVLQLGQVYTIPAAGGAFRSQATNIEMDEKTGLPTTIQVAEKVSGAAAMTGAVKDAADQIISIPKQIAVVYKAKADLADAKAKAGIADEKSVIDAKTALLESKAALKKAEDATAAADKAATP
jgi:hypothetical protein